MLQVNFIGFGECFPFSLQCFLKLCDCSMKGALWKHCLVLRKHYSTFMPYLFPVFALIDCPRYMYSCTVSIYVYYYIVLSSLKIVPSSLLYVLFLLCLILNLSRDGCGLMSLNHRKDMCWIKGLLVIFFFFFGCWVFLTLPSCRGEIGFCKNVYLKTFFETWLLKPENSVIRERAGGSFARET